MNITTFIYEMSKEIYKIDEEIKAKATERPSAFKCLSCPKETICSPEYYMEDHDILFIKPIKKIGCNYFFSYGYTGVCRCPVRKELYRKYKV